MKQNAASTRKRKRRSPLAFAARAFGFAFGVPLGLLGLLYLILLVTPIPLPWVSSQVRNLVVSSLPPGSKLELGDMALALEGFVQPVIQFRPVTYIDAKTGGQVSMDALEIGFSPTRAMMGQAGATVTIVGPHIQVNQDLFGPRLAKFEYAEDPSGALTIKVMEGEDAFPQLNLSPTGVDVVGTLPAAAVGMRSDNDWLVYNLEAMGKSIAGVMEQARLGNFARVVVRGGTLEMNDALYGIFRVFKDIKVDVSADATTSSAKGKFSADYGGTVMSGIIERVEGPNDTARLQASINNLDLGAFVPNINDPDAMGGLVGAGAVSIDIGFNSSTNKLTDGVFRVDLTGTDLRISDQTFPVATSIAVVHWDPALGQFTMDETQVSIGNNSAFLKGVFRMGLDDKYGPTVSMAMTGREVSIASDLGPPETPFSQMTFNGWSAPLYGAVGIDEFAISKPDGAQVAATGRVDMLKRGSGFEMTVAGDGVTADDVKRIWPAFVSADIRSWFVRNITGGKLKASSMKYNFPAGSIDPTKTDQPLPPGAIAIDIVGDGVTFRPTETMNPVKIDGALKLAVRDTEVTISADGATIPTDKGALALANVGFMIGSEVPGEALYEISGDLSGKIPALVAFAKEQQPEAMQKAQLPISLDALDGDLTLSVVSTITVDRSTGKTKSMDYAINGVVQDFGSRAPVQGHTIGDGQLSFLVSQAGYKVSGKAQVDGIGANVMVDGEIKDGAQPNILLSTTMAAEDLKKFGIDPSPFLAGDVTFVARIMPDSSVQLALDLEKAKVTMPDLGISKAVGVPGKAQGAIRQQGDDIEMSQVEIAWGDVKISGAMSVDAKAGLKSADFSQVALSAGDSAQLSIAPLDGGGLSVRLTGEQFDLKPMFKRFFSLGEGSTGGPQATALKQSVRVVANLKRALGFFKTTAFNVNMDITVKGTDLKNAQVQANLGGDRSVSVTTNPTPDGRVMSVAFNDLGTLLRLLGVYPNVEGGEGSLVLTTNTAEQKDDGRFTLKRFAFVNEKNVAQVLGNHSESKAMIARSNKLEFKSGEVDFVRRKDRVEIQDAVLAGSTVGGTARGFIYIDQRRYDITGTYVPLFGLNNAFVKLLGPLAGREGEGLFGVTFAIKGELEDPQFKINPMSALAPGAFRRMFEYRAKEIPRVE